MSDLEVMNIMCDEDKDIRMTGNVQEIRIVKPGGLISIGIDRQSAMDIINNQDDYYVALYVMNRKQFDEIKNKLS